MEPRQEKKVRLRIERLEERIAPAALGQTLTLPQTGHGSLPAPAEQYRASLAPLKI